MVAITTPPPPPPPPTLPGGKTSGINGCSNMYDFSGIRVYLELISTSPVGSISLAVRG